MQTTAPSLARVAVLAGFALSCFGLLLFLWIAFGGPVPLKPKGYRVSTAVAEAGQLATEADVRISGVPVGRVTRVAPEPAAGRARVEIELRAEHVPLPADTRAILRQKTLLGETYVELTPGTRAAAGLPEGGALPEEQVAPTVELDEILRAFDPETRDAFRVWMAEQGDALGERGRALNAALGALAPFGERAGSVVATLERQGAALRRVVRDTGTVLDALSEREGQLRALLASGERAFGATARRDRELREAVAALPGFAREARRVVERVERFAGETDPLVTQLRPAARELSPTLRDLAAVAPDLRALFEGLGPLITASREGFPAAERTLRDLRPLLAQLDPTARELVPLLAYLARYPRELAAFFANAAASTQAREPGGEHYLRTTNPLNPENLAGYPRRVGTNRPNPYPQPGALDDVLRGLAVYEARHCGRGAPTLAPTLPAGPVAPGTPAGELLDRVREIALGGSSGGPTPAPPCVLQPEYGTGEAATRFPPVTAAP